MPACSNNCREAGVFSPELPGKDQIQKLNRLFERLEAHLAGPELTLDDAFNMAVELESSEINDIYSRLTGPIKGPAHVMRKKMGLSATSHFERLKEAASAFNVSPKTRARLAGLLSRRDSETGTGMH